MRRIGGPGAGSGGQHHGRCDTQGQPFEKETAAFQGNKQQDAGWKRFSLIPDRNQRARAVQNLDRILAKATRKTLIPSLRGIPLPDQLTMLQQRLVQALLRVYDPGFLTSSPVADVQGMPISCHCAPDLGPNDPIRTMIEAYADRKNWLADRIAIRTIQQNDVPAHEAALYGQEGVFAYTDIPAETMLTVFGGMLLTDSDDILLDRRIRQLADCDRYHTDPAAPPGSVLEGMGLSMKFNTALCAENIMQVDDSRINLRTGSVTIYRTDNDQPIELMTFQAMHTIKKGSQLCYPYRSAHHPALRHAIES